MTGEWNNPDFVEEYVNSAGNSEVNWYEHEVNLPSLLSLLPQERIRVLDLGCGAGNVTASLANRYDIEGCDASPEMIKKAQTDNDGVEFFVWDAETPFPKSEDKYDAVMSKLTLHFVKDLDKLAKHLKLVIKSGGVFIFSVPHPMSTAPKAGNEYLTQRPYQTEIGSFGLHITMLHRSLQDYLNPFLNTGFVLTGLTEPEIPKDLVDKHNLRPEYAAIPRRINLRLRL